jgi:uncharacterized membrane protein
MTSIIAFVAAIGSGLVAGVFFAFSTFVMKALAQLPSNQGIAAMQSINVIVLNRWFLGTFLGTAVLAAIALCLALLDLRTPPAIYLLAGGLSYLVGSLFVTMAFNVPKNESLAKLDPVSGASAEAWTQYISGWTRWNHVRTAASLASAVFFTLALVT